MTPDPILGTLLAERYRVDRLIGEGAMGRVYQAEHVLMRKRVALKVLHRELTTVPEVVQRFEREARAAAHIEHAHVAGATDFGKLPDGSVYLVLEYVEGTPLSRVIAEGPVELGRVLRMGFQIATALEVAHQQGIVHRDLKPDNLLLVESDDGDDFIKVLDFGIAKVPTDPNDETKAITQVGMVYGTPEYMAPEQALGQEVDGRADLYALGVVLYELLVGRRPYLGPVVGLLGQQLSKPLPKMGQLADVRVPAAVEQFVVELLAPDPSKRIASATAAREQLQALSSALSEGRLAGADNRASALLSISLDEVTSRIEQVTANLPSPVHRVVKSRISKVALLALVFGSLGVFFAIASFGILADDPAPSAPSVEPLSAPPPAPSPAAMQPEDEGVSPIEEQVAAAREEGIPGLEALAAEAPAEGLVHAELSLAYAKEKRYQDAVDSARVALALDPKLNESRKIAGALFRSAQSHEARLASFRLLKGAMGAAGVSIIYDLGHIAGISPRVQREAQKLLATEEVRSVAAPGLLLLLDFESFEATNHPTCEQAADLVRRAALVGDKRVLDPLRPLAETKGCGRAKQDDCFPCLRKEELVEKAVSKINQRATLSDPDE